ncbi:ABC transporter transmembrane domain-containing protein [Vibrio hangzhouensis]|uniref:ABC transporter transmembrane domain-containing protein n=1 Tax=Vibrio hangzhouensis TaxID=462991 RepID=UPI001C95B675|nr:ABC transporter transmembrane domain-containing protein [Vibrio hangzhouensis]MBY6196824.1 ATP-binding cassette domain-containing protein [Vibrio hangzhouensis]
MNELERTALSSLRALEVSSNVDVFAHQWVDEYGLNNLQDYISLLDRINVPYRIVEASNNFVNERFNVAVLVSDDKFDVVKQEHKGLKWLSSERTPTQLTYYDVALLLEDAPPDKPDPNWMGSRLTAYKAVIPRVALASFFSNLFALAIPFITMSIYDHVIGGDAAHELFGIAVGAALLFFMLWLLRVLRSQTLATVANRLSREISDALIKKLLTGSYHVCKSTPQQSQVSQLGFAERISSVLAGPLGNVLFDIPFVLIFLIAIAALGGWLVGVPILALLLYFLIARSSIKNSAIRANQSTVSGTNRQALIAELSTHLGFMRSSHVLNGWLTRFDKANYLAAKNGFRQSVHQAKYTSIYYAIGVISTLAVVGLGIELIFNDVMSAGGLIATMMLISRVTGPAQTLANSALRLQQLGQTQMSINRALTLNTEESYRYQHQDLPKTAPRIELDQITLRYAKQAKPALSGISAVIEPGEVVAITGPANSGKTSLIDTIASFQPVQNGVVNVDGINLSQYTPLLYRHWMFYQAAHPQVLLTNIRDWFSDRQQLDDGVIIRAIEQAGGKEWLESLKHGLDTDLTAFWPATMHDLLSRYEARMLITAKAMAIEYPLYLMDNPVQDGSPESIELFSSFLKQRRGKATIIFSSQDADLIKQADKVMVLNQGSVAYYGPLAEEEPNQTDTMEIVANE